MMRPQAQQAPSRAVGRFTCPSRAVNWLSMTRIAAVDIVRQLIDSPCETEGGKHGRQQGNRVTRADDGNARRFMCTYHGWTFENDGRLTHIPGEQEAYYGAMDKSDMGLVEAKVDTYAGIIFANWDKDAPSLEAWLGDARWYMDTIFNRSDAGMIAIGPQKWMEPCNWKTAVDNCSDNYHVPITHYSSMHARYLETGEAPYTMEAQLAEP